MEAGQPFFLNLRCSDPIRHLFTLDKKQALNDKRTLSPPLTSSFGQIRRRNRASSDQSLSLSESKEEETCLGPAIRGGNGGGGGASHRSNDINNPRSTVDARPTAASGAGLGTPPRVTSGRTVALTASPSADGSSPATAHDYGALAAGNADAGDIVAGGPDEVFVGEPRAGRGGWGGVFAGTSRRITR